MKLIKFSKLIVPVMLAASLILAIACSSESAPAPAPQAPAPYPTAAPAPAAPAPTAVTSAPVVPVAAPDMGPKYGGQLRWAHHLDYDVLDLRIRLKKYFQE